jgi:large exoprotein involved in heme utilization and adhesion
VAGAGSQAEAVTVAVSGDHFEIPNGISTSTTGYGNAGNISVDTARLTLRNGGNIGSVGTGGDGGEVQEILGTRDFGRPGTVTVRASQDVMIEGKIPTSPGNFQNSSIAVSGGFGIGEGGNIVLTTPALTLSGGGQITAETTGTRNGGAIEINAGTVTLSTGGQILSNTLVIPGFETLARGAAGTVTIQGLQGTGSQAGSVLIEGTGTGIFTNTQGLGAGGNISIAANSVTLQDGGTLSAATSGSATTATGGTITVNANQVQLNNGASISASSTGPGNAGNIQIAASDSLVMQNHGSITTATAQSDGGNITLQVGRLVQLTDSTITTSVQGGTGNGGNITIDPQFVILQGSQIIAFGGNGGNILIVAGVFFADPFSTISASSTLGINGTVSIQAPVTSLSGTLAPLPGEIVQATELLQARCAARIAGGTSGSFVVAGRDGVPLEPGGLLPSPLYVESPGSTRLAGALDVPGLRVGRTFTESNFTLAPLASGCSS